ncbi:MAG: tRNA (adenosine(37)-N6)-threonylcarbamoyltransferase complex transferase subunit TsaD [Candidatus Pacebacteria bacterium]|nr:tRNA (adenosine(37)-N6)-threonylcarbamoyltransferase complex transferase subunit TsaD [Candidatus Paceibacterota bacterium]
MIILAVETSCDETAVAIVEFKENKVKVLANIVSSQVKAHSKYGGVVPSLAARMHLKNMAPVLKRAFKQVEKKVFSEGDIPECRLQKKLKIDYIAATKGPGLIPALTIGVSAAKALAYALDKSLVGVNHLEGHIYSNWLTEFEKSKVYKVHKVKNDFKLWKPEFPILCLIVSGGHTQLILMKKDLKYKIIGETLDDAAGEAFDKVAKLLGLGYPGGPLIEKIAKKGDENKFKFTRPMMHSGDYNFSFSGLKTAVLYEVKSYSDDAPHPNPLPRGEGAGLPDKYKADISASFQQAVIDVLVSKTIKAAKQYKVKNIILGGGVSANKELRKQFGEKINKEIPNTKYQIPNASLSTDNALMIAVAAYYNIIGEKNIGSWRSVKADANLKIE